MVQHGIEDPRYDLITLLLKHNVLSFGDFVLKSGRKSPYFFNLGALNTGSACSMLGDAYARMVASLPFKSDGLLGPAYKGIPLAVSTALSMWRHGWGDLPVTYSRKEIKNHGEGGAFVGSGGAQLVLVDDVLTAGTAALQTLSLARSQGWHVQAIVVCLDREEPAKGHPTAKHMLEQQEGVAVYPLLTLSDIIGFLKQQDIQHAKRLEKHRENIQG